MLREAGSGIRHCFEKTLEGLGRSLAELRVTLELGSNEVVQRGVGIAHIFGDKGVLVLRQRVVQCGGAGAGNPPQNQKHSQHNDAAGNGYSRHGLFPRGSGDDRLDRLAEINFEPLVARHFEFTRVKAELLKHGCVNVGDVVPVFDCVETNFVSGTMHDP